MWKEAQESNGMTIEELVESNPEKALRLLKLALQVCGCSTTGTHIFVHQDGVLRNVCQCGKKWRHQME